MIDYQFVKLRTILYNSDKDINTKLRLMAQMVHVALLNQIGFYGPNKSNGLWPLWLQDLPCG